MELPRGEFFAGLFVLGCANGLASQMLQSVNRLGWTDAFFGTFEISVIIWISCAAGVYLVLQDRTIGIRPQEPFTMCRLRSRSYFGSLGTVAARDRRTTLIGPHPSASRDLQATWETSR
jgi:hypothetical protein